MQYVKSILTCLLLLLQMKGSAQEIMIPPDAKYITKFSFTQFTGGVILIKAKIDTLSQELNFILDTGSGGISLDSATVAEFNLPTKTSDTTINGFGGLRKVNFVFNKSLRLPGLDVHNLNFHVIDYETLTGVYGEKIDGIIGYSFLSRYVLKVNYDKMEIEVYSKGKIDYPRAGTLLRPAFTALPIQYVGFKDKRKMGYNFYVDTGAGLCLLLSERLTSDSAVLTKKRKPVVTGAEGMMGKVRMRLTVIKEVKLGPYKFKLVPTYIYKDDHNVTSYPFTGGVIGSEILRRFNLIINYSQREIHLLPNSHYNDPFDYAYTGLSIYGREDKIIVEDIIYNSPAHLAGFELGDEILSVGNLVGTTVQAYKNALQMLNQPVKVIVKRKGELVSITMNTGSIL